jgi:rSAM-associated Gly-rich repeat protein
MGKAVNGSGAIMDKLSRRSLLRTLAGGAVSTVGTVILARSSLAALGTPENAKPGAADVQARAAELSDSALGSAGEAHAQFLNFPGVGFGNGGFRNGGFWNGGFRNGGFRNGGFRNGFRNGGFRNGGFRNGFRNW